MPKRLLGDFGEHDTPGEIRGGYKVYEREYWYSEDGREPVRVHDKSQANLVSSRLVRERDYKLGGIHGPLFDLDYRAEGHVRGDGGLTVTLLCGPKPARDVRKFLTELVDLGIADHYFTTKRGESLYDAQDYMEVPIPEIRFIVPATLRPSMQEGRFHLLVDAVVGQAAWESLLRAAANAGVITKNYKNHSLKRGASHLWLPGKKAAVVEARKAIVARGGARIYDDES